jgi:uncharacterized protein with HEPN domain
MSGEVDRLPQLKRELDALLASAERISARGRDLFFDSVDDTQRLAAEALVVRLADLVSRLPVGFTEGFSQVPWVRITGMRNRLAHDYRRTDARLVWAVIAVELPRIRTILDGGPDGS